ncbi:MAG: hypothetical protein K2W94_05040 [Alphaproteobacteria bacterium]|nr:hypothetical protein [Alphaproteobacteria bacterium]
MKRKILVLFSFLITSFLCCNAYADVKENPQDIKSIQKIAKNLRHSLAITWAERQKAVERGYETKFDSTFGEAQILVDNLFIEINSFLETQNPSQIAKDKGDNLKPASPEKLNQNALKVLAQFQVLMDHLQSTLHEVKALSTEELSLYPNQQTNKRIIASAGKSKQKRRMRTVKAKRLLDNENAFAKPSIRYQISGTQIDMPDPTDESFIH